MKTKFKDLLSFGRVKRLAQMITDEHEDLALDIDQVQAVVEWLEQHVRDSIILAETVASYRDGLRVEGLDKELREVKIVTIPAKAQHEGMYSMSGYVYWTCPVCGGPRGELGAGRSYDGSMSLWVNVWSNPCGHGDSYERVRGEMHINGLNK